MAKDSDILFSYLFYLPFILFFIGLILYFRTTKEGLGGSINGYGHSIDNIGIQTKKNRSGK
jgi:hypothetical protein